MHKLSDLDFTIIKAINEQSGPDSHQIEIPGFDFNTIFERLVFLFRDNFISADTEYDEAKEIIVLDDIELLPKGIKYLRENSSRI